MQILDQRDAVVDVVVGHAREQQDRWADIGVVRERVAVHALMPHPGPDQPSHVVVMSGWTPPWFHAIEGISTIPVSLEPTKK